MRRLSFALFLTLLLLMAFAWIPACGSNGDVGFDPNDGKDGSTIDGPNGGEFPDGSRYADGRAVDPLTIEPSTVTVQVEINNGAVTANPVAFKAKANGREVDATWSIDRGELGKFAASGGAFTPSGNLGGIGKITARSQARIGVATVIVEIKMTQNGAPASPGGGGVGGSPLGGPVDGATKGRLDGPATPAADLVWLYPYDGTVWPRGLFAPLLQWQSGRAAKAVSIHLSSTGFDFKGYFAGNNLVNQPILQSAWDKATYGNRGDALKVELRIDDGSKTYGTITRTWKVAAGVLKGTVYYNSYNTKLVTYKVDGNSGGILSIKPGQTFPVLTVPGAKDKCIVCHTVSDDGSTLFSQQTNYADGASYNLRNGAAVIKNYTGDAPGGTTNNRKFLWSGVYRDGTFALQSSGYTQESYPNESQIFARDDGRAMPATGFDAVVKQAVTPAFSPDGKKVAFNYWTAENDSITPKAGNGRSLAVMDFACGAGGSTTGGPSCGSFAFSGLREIFRNPDAPADKGFVGWPAWLPDGKALVFHNVMKVPTSGSVISTWHGAQAQISYVDMNGASNALRALNGANPDGSNRYLPTNAQHPNDELLNYEPTVNPIASGGYYWVVFTSRRMYGNVAPGDPYDLGTGDNPTPKKLWVAAIDINAPAGTDPSHPAFYLPGQELNAGNLRGFWSVDPCHQNGTSCQTGDECCNGFCRENTPGGGLVCTDKPSGCAQEYESCTTTSDCCAGGGDIRCLNNRCAQIIN
ncbi:hypothetical protein [Pendulispora albinea]|uniref:TolB protein n=1 Tax=Pendulispora albinea TaxID=2741071 RepID=A0ABZ2M5G3_9BACT